MSPMNRTHSVSGGAGTESPEKRVNAISRRGLRSKWHASLSVVHAAVRHERTSEIGTVEHGAGEDSARQARLGKVGALKIGLAQRGIHQSGIVEIGALEIGPAQGGLHQICRAQVCSAQG